MRAIIFSRVSSVTDRQTTDAQIAKLQKYAEVKGWDIVEVYSEKISGNTKNKDREVLNDCLEFVKNNNIDIILCDALDRLSRNILECQEIVKYLSDNKINAHFLKENITLLNEETKEINPCTHILLTCLQFTAEQERKNIYYRLSSARAIAKENGIKMGRKIGYRKPKETKEKQYSFAISKLKKGMRVADVLRCCRAEGIKISEGTLWNLKKEFC